MKRRVQLQQYLSWKGFTLFKTESVSIHYVSEALQKILYHLLDKNGYLEWILLALDKATKASFTAHMLVFIRRGIKAMKCMMNIWIPIANKIRLRRWYFTESCVLKTCCTYVIWFRKWWWFKIANVKFYHFQQSL